MQQNTHQDKLTTRFIRFLRKIDLFPCFQFRIVDPIARACGEETSTQLIARALTQGIDREKLDKEIEELEAMADAIEQESREGFEKPVIRTLLIRQ